ncbi:MAG: methyltransferase, partial [Pseudomonadota bacterium]
VHPADFRTDPLPAGADAISLIRVLYDHETATVRRLLSQTFEALPPNGRLLISEPMSGGNAPHRAGDAYFAIYCKAMGTGTVRSPAEITRLLTDAGFTSIDVPRMRRRFITQTIVARKPL